MPLIKQKVGINVASGIDTKSDEKHTIPGKLRSLTNGVMRKRGRVDKRDGHTLIQNTDISGNDLGSGDSLVTYRDELLQYNNQKLYSYSSSAQNWIDKGSAISVVTKTRQVLNNNYQQTQVDCAINGNIALYGYEDSRGGVRATVIDESTGTPLLSDVSIDASASRVRCVSFSSYLYIYYYKTGSIYCRRINPQAASAFEAAVEVSSVVDTTDSNYDVINYEDIRMMLVHTSSTAGETELIFIDDGPTVLSGVLAPVTISEDSTDAVCIFTGPDKKVIIAFSDTTNNDVRATVVNNGGTQLVAPLDIDTTLSVAVRNITGYISDDQEVTFLYEVDATNDYDHYIKENTLTMAGSAGTPAVFKRSVGLWGKAFTFMDTAGTSQSFVPTVHVSTLQSTYFVVRHDGVIASKELYSVAGPHTTRTILSNVSQLGEKFQFACLKKNRLVSTSGAIFTPTGISSTTLDFTNNDIFTAAELGETLHIVGGVLSMYDGESVVEHGFHLYPENITTATATSGGGLSDSTSYTAKFIFEWTDRHGKIHRSAPSLAVSQSTSAGGAVNDNTITFTVPTLRLTAKDGTTRAGIRVVGYVLDPTTGIYYRFTDVDATPNNDVTADSVDVVLTAPALTSNEILYTTGNVLDNFAPPASSTIAVYKNRIFLGGLEEGGKVWYSKEHKQGEPVEFTDTFIQSFEPLGGDDTALGVLDDKLLLFKKNRYYYTFGNGPNNLGFDGSFAEFQFVSADIGCDNGNSLVVTPNGLMAKSQKGIYLIDRALGSTYIGAEVEDFNTETITSGVFVADKNQIRFTTLAGPILVYDYYYNVWSTFTGLSAKRAVIWDSSYVILRTNGEVLKESSTVFTDAGTSYALGLEMGWLAIDGIGGFQRIYELQIRGEYKSKHKLACYVGYDYTSSYESQVVFDPSSIFSVAKYGETSPYGADETYGGQSVAYRFSVAMQRQKCESIRFKIEEQPSSEDNQSGLSISDMILKVGIKGGTSRLRTSQTVGASK